MRGRGEGVLGTAAGKDKATGTSHRASPGSSHAAGGCTPAHPHSHTSGRASPSGPGWVEAGDSRPRALLEGDLEKSGV